eukprot:TRINITY_DN7571_c0_g1_i3.p1 TRINITY_DN7571_c0_g1~~TRINITY_DN7571_c0_g1_i3.p1  ORF type:complete len:261 (-),score=34.92 TRINITY_DN7571_c0_g1_i3:56-838(-)
MKAANVRLHASCCLMKVEGSFNRYVFVSLFSAGIVIHCEILGFNSKFTMDFSQVNTFKCKIESGRITIDHKLSHVGSPIVLVNFQEVSFITAITNAWNSWNYKKNKPKALPMKKKKPALKSGSGTFDLDLLEDVKITQLDWEKLLAECRIKFYKEGEKIQDIGDQRSFIQVLYGKAAVYGTTASKKIKVRELNPKSVYGISSYIKGNYSLTKKQVVAESETVVICKISPAYINIVIEKFPFLGGQFYCYLAGVLSSSYLG